MKMAELLSVTAMSSPMKDLSGEGIRGAAVMPVVIISG
jgi:hypothetical protein